jgi:glycosyltransferase involved in cell wall biosynthesis
MTGGALSPIDSSDREARPSLIFGWSCPKPVGGVVVHRGGEPLVATGFAVDDQPGIITARMNGEAIAVLAIPRPDIDRQYGHRAWRAGWRIEIPARQMEKTNRVEILVDGCVVNDRSIEVTDASVKPLHFAYSQPKPVDGKIAHESGRDFRAVGFYASGQRHSLRAAFNGERVPVRLFQRSDVEEKFNDHPYRTGWEVKIDYRRLAAVNELAIYVDGELKTSHTIHVDRRISRALARRWTDGGQAAARGWRRLRVGLANHGLGLGANERRIGALWNRHKGETAWLIGNGPSVRTEDLERLAGCVTFACNRFYLAYEGMRFRPTYLGSNDRQMIRDFGREMIEKHPGTVFFISEDAPDVKGNHVWVRLRSRTPLEFSEELYEYVMPGGGTLVGAMQIGYHMGITRFYLYGVDHNFTYQINEQAKDEFERAVGDGNHFIPNYRSGRVWCPPVTWQIEGALLSCHLFLQSKGGWVKNATRGGKLEVLERVDFDEIMPPERGDRKTVMPGVTPAGTTEAFETGGGMWTVIVAAYTPPVPPDQGNRRVIHELLKWLKGAGYRVIYVLQWGGISPEMRVQSEALADEFIVIGDVIRKAGGKIEKKRKSTECWPETSEEVRRLASLWPTAAVIAEYIHMTPCFEGLPASTLKLTHTHDMLSRVGEAIAAAGTDTQGREVTAEAEREALLRGDAIIALQHEEARAFKDLVPERDVIVLGHAPHTMVDEPAKAPRAGMVLMMGSGNPLNRRGLERFCSEAWPRVLEQAPEARLVVIGKVGETLPPGTPQAEALGTVDDIDSQFARAWVTINPVDLGTGLKIKTLDMLAQGKAMVSTRAGVEGMAGLEAETCLVAENWADFADKVAAVLADEGLRRRLEEGALGYARRHLTPEAVFGEFRTRLERHFGASVKADV